MSTTEASISDCLPTHESGAIDLENALGFLITETSYLMRKYLISRLKEQGRDYGLSIDEFPLLARVHERSVIGQSELNQLTLKDKATVTRTLARMEKKGLVCRCVNSEDQRARDVSLGTQGQKLVQYLLPEILKIRTEVTIDIDEADLQVTLRTMQKLYRQFSELVK